MLLGQFRGCPRFVLAFALLIFLLFLPNCCLAERKSFSAIVGRQRGFNAFFTFDIQFDRDWLTHRLIVFIFLHHPVSRVMADRVRSQIWICECILSEHQMYLNLCPFVYWSVCKYVLNMLMECSFLNIRNQSDARMDTYIYTFFGHFE